MKVALILISALAGVLALGLVAVVLTSETVTVGGFPELANEGEALPPEEDGPIRRVRTETNDGSGWKDVDLEIELLEARTANPPRDQTLGIEEPGKRWIAAEFEVRNRADDNSDNNGPTTLTAIDTEGRSHSAGGLPVVEPELPANVPARRSRTGYLSVQVPNDARIERLEADVVGEAIGWDLDQAL
jgi:hypothetical protein